MLLFALSRICSIAGYMLALTLPGLKAQLASVAVDDNAVAILDRAADDLSCQFSFYAALQEPLDRSCAVSRIITLVCDKFLSSLCERQLDVPFFQTMFYILHAQIDDLDDLILSQRREYDDLIDTVEEFRTEVLLRLILNLLFHIGINSAVLTDPVDQIVASDVMITMVFLKSTVLPWLSVKRPSSSSCSRMLNTSG